ncbi:hypothetical protein EDD29_8503 [Actinocorallia herbida]|uniref:Uncharacterized protein n=1 Tax=Actinocorallia herbida TaxID=58109 RepID=A0A3N1DB66_9ACTN|nr:hypothetical protein [Actinocorallia herbida]ROO90764.1 hypothetical protein EDD29_8503 [Actinocorallia herbida]
MLRALSVLGAAAAVVLALFQVPAAAAEDDARLSIAASPVKAAKGDKVTVAGLVEATAGGDANFFPWPGVNVRVTMSHPSSKERIHLWSSTKTDGLYSVTFELPYEGPEPVTFRAEATVHAKEISATVEVPVDAPPPGPRLEFFGTTTIKMDEWGRITARGSAKTSQAGGKKLRAQFRLQFSKNGKPGTWKTVKTTDLKPATTASLALKRFYYGRSGYWRWLYPGDGVFKRTVGETVKAWRWATYFTGWKITPKKVGYKKKITLSGRLWEYTGPNTKRGVRYQNLSFYFTCDKTGDGKEWYSDYSFARTDANGRFSKTEKAVCTGKVIAVYPGRKGYFASETDPVRLTVTGSPYRATP